MQSVDSQIHIWENARMSPQHRQIPTYSMADALKEMAEAGVDAPEESDEVFVVKSPVEQGIAMIRAPLAGPSRAPGAEEALKATSCGPHAR